MKKPSYKDNVNHLYERYLTKTKRTEYETLTYHNGEFIIMEGDEINSFYFVVSGKVKVLRNYENGKTFLLRIYDSFTLLGDIEYFLKINASCSVQTQAEVKVIKVPYSHIDKVYKTDDLFLYNILVQTSSKILLTSDQTSINLMHSLDTRFASYLLSLVEEDNDVVVIPSLVDIANHLGTSYRHLTRTIKKLTDKGAIMKNKNKIKLLDRLILLKIAEGNIYESKAEYNIEG